jgi:hypothetical protein
MNWISTVQRTKEELHRFGTADVDTVKRALARAIEYYKDYSFFFNQATYDITLTAGTYAYGEESSDGAADGYPSDFYTPLSLVLVASSYEYPPMTQLDIQAFRRAQELSTSRGYPYEYTILDDEILLNPNPSDDFTLRLDYIKDIGTPSATYNGTTWAYTVDGTTLLDSYTNAWMTHGQDLIVERAKAIVLGSNFKDLEAAQASRILENEYMGALLRKNEKGYYPSTPEPWT